MEVEKGDLKITKNPETGLLELYEGSKLIFTSYYNISYEVNGMKYIAANNQYYYGTKGITIFKEYLVLDDNGQV